MPSRNIGHPLLDRALSLVLSHGNFIGFFHAHDRKIFRQSNNARTTGCGQFNQARRLLQIGFHSGPACHLHCRDAKERLRCLRGLDEWFRE